MFLILLHYQRPLDEVDRLVPEHRAYLQRHYAAGDFMLSGRKEPRDGGVILARAASREDLDRVIAQDPFHREGVARYEVLEFIPSLAAPGLEGWLEA